MATYTEAQYNEVLQTTAAALQEKESQITAIKTDRDRLAALLAVASSAFDSGDTETLEKLREQAKKTEKEKAIEAAKAELESAQAKLAELSQ